MFRKCCHLFSCTLLIIVSFPFALFVCTVELFESKFCSHAFRVGWIGWAELIGWSMPWLIKHSKASEICMQSISQWALYLHHTSISLADLLCLAIGWSAIQWCSGAGTHRNAVPVNILGPERRSGSYPSSQAERYCCSVPANVCRQDQICLFWN